jgi:hypothetical protein
MLNSRTASTTTAEFAQLIQMLSVTGVDAGTPGNAKVGQYVAVEAAANSGNVWASNPLVQITSASPPTAQHQVAEFDVNNDKGHVVSALGPSGIRFHAPSLSGASLSVYGIAVESSGQYEGTAAIVVDGSVGWLRGVGCHNSGGNVIRQACFFDYSHSPIAFDIWGRHHIGIDLSNAAFEGNADVLKWANGSLTNNGAYYFGGSGDTGIVIRSSGAEIPAWNLQTIVSAGSKGRFRLYDAKNDVEVMSITPGGITTTFSGIVSAKGISTFGHIADTGKSVRIISGFGGSASVIGGDTAGRVVIGTGGSSVGVLAFGSGYAESPPSCFAQNETRSNPIRATPKVNQLTLTGTMMAGDKVNYWCVGVQ